MDTTPQHDTVLDTPDPTTPVRELPERGPNRHVRRVLEARERAERPAEAPKGITVGELLGRLHSLEEAMARRQAGVLEDAGKERLRKVAQIERERADRMEKLLLETKEALAASVQREVSLVEELRELTAPVAASMLLYNQRYELLSEIGRSMEEAVGGAANRVEAAGAQQLSAFTAQMTTVGDTLDRLQEQMVSVTTLHAKLLTLRDEINCRIGTLNAKLPVQAKNGEVVQPILVG